MLGTLSILFIKLNKDEDFLVRINLDWHSIMCTVFFIKYFWKEIVLLISGMESLS